MNMMDQTPSDSFESPIDAPAAMVAPAASAATPAVGLSREQILEVTTRCLREHGYDATTIRRIARMLSCAVGSIYRYYRDKHELLFGVTQSLFEHVAQLAEDGSVDQSVRAYAEVAREEPEAYCLLFWLACQGKPAAAPPSLPPVVQRVAAGWAKKLGSARDAQRAWAMLHGCLMAGETVDACAAAVASVTAAPREPQPVAAATLPRSSHIPRIVTVLKQPPMPLQQPSAVQAHEPSLAATAGHEDDRRP